MSERTFTAVIHTEEDLFVAYCPEVGTVSQGCTVEEAVANLKEATELYLEELPPPENCRREATCCSMASRMLRFVSSMVFPLLKQPGMVGLQAKYPSSSGSFSITI